MEHNLQTRYELEKLISQLESQLEDLQARLPAHSISPNLIEELDELDHRLNAAKSAIKELDADVNRS